MHPRLLHLLLPLAVTARDVVFPPVSGVQSPLVTSGDDTIAEFPEPNAYAGLTTFANSPFVKCLADGEVERFDIAFLGAPFDTVCLWSMIRISADPSMHKGILCSSRNEFQIPLSVFFYARYER